MLRKVISGGQNGVDQAALRAAKRVGFETGGKLPLGCRTIAGARRDLLVDFGMEEHESPEYPPRTNANVRESDATLRIACDFMSAGERCTLAALRRHERPYLDVLVTTRQDGGTLAPVVIVSDVVDWIRGGCFRVLNVAGNSEVTAPGIGVFADAYLTSIFEHLIG